MSRLVKIALCAVAVSGFFMVNDADAGLFGRKGNDCCGSNGGGGGGLFGHHRGNDCGGGGGRGGLFGHKRGNDCGCPQPVCCEPAPVCCPQPEPICCPQPQPICCPQPQPTCCAAPVVSSGCCGSGASYGGVSYGGSYGGSYGSPVYYGGATSGCANCGTTMDAGMIQSGSSIPPSPMADPNTNAPAGQSPSDAVPSA